MKGQATCHVLPGLIGPRARGCAPSCVSLQIWLHKSCYECIRAPEKARHGTGMPSASARVGVHAFNCWQRAPIPSTLLTARSWPPANGRHAGTNASGAPSLPSWALAPESQKSGSPSITLARSSGCTSSLKAGITNSNRQTVDPAGATNIPSLPRSTSPVYYSETLRATSPSTRRAQFIVAPTGLPIAGEEVDCPKVTKRDHP